MSREDDGARSANRRAAKAILYEHAVAAGMEPCSDHSCILGSRGGMGTNGGCRCGRHLEGAALSIWIARLRSMLASMAEEIREAREKAGKP